MALGHNESVCTQKAAWVSAWRSMSRKGKVVITARASISEAAQRLESWTHPGGSCPQMQCGAAPVGGAHTGRSLLDCSTALGRPAWQHLQTGVEQLSLQASHHVITTITNACQSGSGPGQVCIVAINCFWACLFWASTPY